MSRRPARTLVWQASVPQTVSTRSFSDSASPHSASSSARSRTSAATSRPGNSAGTSRTTTAPGPNASSTRPNSASSSARAGEPRRRRLVELDDLGQQQALARDAMRRQRLLHALVDEPLMRGVLVDQDDAGRGLGQDVGAVQLRPRGAERRLRRATALGGVVGLGAAAVGAAVGREKGVAGFGQRQ